MRVAAAALITVVSSYVVLSTAGAAPVQAGEAKVVHSDGSGGLHSGGSATPFAVELPSGATCPGDTMHDYYLVDTYALPATIALSTVRFPDGYPTVGDDLITIQGSPFIANNTDPFTGLIPNLPAFSWAPYAHQNELRFTTYNVGVVCANRNSQPTRFWNTQILFAASSTDPGGFTWTVVGGHSGSSGSSHLGVIIGVVLAAVIIGGGTAMLLSRRRSFARSAA